MNRKPKALLRFTRLSCAGLLAKTESIINAMSGNPHFPSPDPAIATVATANAAYADALQAADTGSRADIAAKNQHRNALQQLLKELAGYVNFTAKGDRAVLLTSGFDINNDGLPAVITKPAGLKVLNGPNSGELISKVPIVDGSRSYSHEYSLDPALADASWKPHSCTRSKFIFKGLQPGKQYFVRVGAVGSKDQKVYSDVISRIVI